jgi:hypothetical protein
MLAIFIRSHGILLSFPLTVDICCRGGFRRALLFEGHGTAKRESVLGAPQNPPCNMYSISNCSFILGHYLIQFYVQTFQ